MIKTRDSRIVFFFAKVTIYVMIKTRDSRKCLIYKAFDKTIQHSVKRLQPAVTWIHFCVGGGVTFATRYLKSMNNMEDIFKKDLSGAMVSPDEPGYDQLIGR